MAENTTPKGPAPGAEPRVVIRPAGALPPGGVRTTQGIAGHAAVQPPAAAAKAAAARKKAKPAARRAKRPAGPSLAARLKASVKGMRLRILPVTIFVAVLMLGLRVGDLWRIAARDAQLPDFPVSHAEATAPKPGDAKPGDAKTAAGSSDAPAKGQGQPAAAPAQGGASASSSPPPVTAADGPLGPVRNEELLQHFAERRAELERRVKEAEQREALLAAAEKRIDQKIQEMDKVRADIQKLMKDGDQKQSEQIDSLVKIYETMKPKDAARIFEELEMPVLLGVIQRMKEQKTALVLAAMDPVKAKEVTSALVASRTLPALPQP